MPGTRVVRWGNSLAVRIPKPIAEEETTSSVSIGRLNTPPSTPKQVHDCSRKYERI